jgi:hypothetical protein
LSSCRATIPLSNHVLVRLADLIRVQHVERRCRWRRLAPAQQALLVLTHLRNCDTYTRLAASFAVGTTTTWRYVRESVDLLAALADDLRSAVVCRRGRHAHPSSTASPMSSCTTVETQVPRDECPGRRRPGRSTRVGLACSTRRYSRCGRSPHGRPDRRPDRRRREDLLLQGLTGRGRHDPRAIQAPSPPSTALSRVKGRQLLLRPDPLPRRARHRDLEDLEGTDQAALLPAPRHRDRAGHPRPAHHRRGPLLRMRRAR